MVLFAIKRVDFMKKTKTLKKNYEFKRILTKGKYLSGKYIECFYINNKVKNNNFIGIAVSSKMAKANKRNKIKRIIRENYKNIEQNIKTGKSIVFLWKKSRDVLDCTYCNVKKDMLKIMKEMDMLINE